MTWTWTNQQERALRDVDQWIKERSKLVYRLDGYAGTGKTTLARHLAQNVGGSVYFMAYTGKAAHVLRKSGIPNAGTIHSFLYAPQFKDQSELRAMKKRLEEEELHPSDRAELEFDIRYEEARLRKPSFGLREDTELHDASLIVIDEYSMVNGQLGADLESLNVPMLLLGDPMQLPPVRGTGYFTNGTPDTMLTEITRQALDSPIIRYATMVREGGSVPYGNDGAAMKVQRSKVTDDMLPRAGQLLCGLNKTRRALNTTMRRELGFCDPLPVKGDRLVCLKNERDTGLLNGMVVTALADSSPDLEGEIVLSVDNDGVEVPDVIVNSAPFLMPEMLEDGWEHGKTYPMEYGYALTVHKAQGSQWDRVTVMDDGFAKREPANRQRWLYTAITRAAEKLVIVA